MKSILVAFSCAPMEKRSKPDPHRSARRPSLDQRLLSTWFQWPALCSLVVVSLIATLVLVVHAANTQNLTSTTEPLWSIMAGSTFSTLGRATGGPAFAPFVVTKTADTNDGACLVTDCSLRDALIAANATPGADTITFNIPIATDSGCNGGAGPCTISLDTVLPDINGDLNINGPNLSSPGDTGITVKRSINPVAGNFRVFAVDAGATVSIDHLTIANGNLSGTATDPGGGILNNGLLTLNSVTVSANIVGGNNTDVGGGIFNSRTGMLLIANSTISGNQANGNGVDGGGGIFNSGTLTIINSTLSGNAAGDNGQDGGGGIFNSSLGTLSLINCTVSGNTAGGSGDNVGGGIVNAGTADARNTIIAGNIGSSSPDFRGTLTSQGHNVIGSTSGTIVVPQPGDLFDGAASPLNLGALGNNGGPTQTMALNAGSVAIDAGDDCVVSSTACANPVLTTDQRGAGFLRQNGSHVDIGAFEVPSLVVNSTADTDDGLCTTDPAGCTLREAINAANLQPDTNAISFDPAVFAAPGPHTINLTGALPDINTNMSIAGPAANVLTVRRTTGGEYRIFTVGNSVTVTISGLTIADGNLTTNGVDDKGAGINNIGSLTLSAVTISGNVVGGNQSDDGGGIYNGGALLITNSTISGNEAGGVGIDQGGGIYNDGTLTIINSTLSGNRADGSNADLGGAIYNSASGILSLTNCTLSNNTAAGGGNDHGGGILNLGTVHARNTIIAGNISNEAPDFSGTLTSQGHNLIGDTTGMTGATASDLIGTAGLNLAATLADNGGPTQTLKLNSPSTAIDAGDDCVVDSAHCGDADLPQLTTDQRGTGFPRIFGAHVDIGAFEAEVCVTPPATPTASNSGPYCEGATIQLSTPTVSGATYSWTGPNGFTSSAQNPNRANATTADAGTYFVTITVNGCTSAAGSTTVVVNPTPATPTATNGGPYCEGATIQLSTPTVSGATYSWTGPNGFTSSAQNPTRANATTADAGTYFVTITVNGCTSAAGSTNVVVNPTPATPTASSGGPYCEGQTIQLSTPFVSGATYSWTGPNGFTSSLQNPSRSNASTADAGIYSVTVTVAGCTSAAGTTNVVVNPTPATPTASNGGPYCESQTIQLSTPTVIGATYSWTGPNGFTSALQNPTKANATTADAGTYFVTITVNGCTSAAGSTTVVVNATPATPTASNGGPYCEGATIQLSTPFVSGATYSWIGPNGFTSSAQNPIRANATTSDAGTYFVTITVNGCTSAAGSTTVVVNPTPATPTGSNGGPYSEGQTIQLSTPTVSGATYSWTGPNGFTSTLQNPTRANATTADAGTYSVTVTVNGCPSPAGTTNVIVLSVRVQFAQANTNDTETNAGSHVANVIVSRSGSTIGAVDVTYNITDGTATTADSDYSVAQATGTLHWNDGDGTDKNIAITVIGDTKYEPDETVNLSLSSPSGATLGSQATATLTIVNDDSPVITGHIDYCITPGANVPNATINVTGSQTASTTTDASGNYSIALPQGGSYTLTPSKTALTPGAASIDTADVIAAQRQFLGMMSLNGCALTAADATKDSIVDTADVLAIQQFFLLMTSGTAHVGEWQFNPANPSYANLSADQVSQNFDALVFGDVSGDLTPAPIANHDEPGSTAANQLKPSLVASVSLPIANIGVNQTDVTLVVTTTNIDPADNLVGFQGDFTFDSSVVTFQATPASPAGLTATNWNVSANILGAGTIKTLRISAFSTTSTPLSGSGTLFNLNVTRVTNTVGANTPLIWGQSPNNFVFIDTTLAKPSPGSTPDGSITIVGPTAANGRVAGQVLDSNGDAIEGAAVRMSGTQNRLTITDAAGNYFFDNVETNGLYVISPSRANFSFSPAQRTFSQLGAQTEATFTGAANNSGANPLDTTEYFVRQQYLDFLGREPDESGFNFWINNIESCGADRGCREVKRIDTSAAFFLSIEFQHTGYTVYRIYEAAYGNLAGTPVPLKLNEFAPDTRQIGDGVVVLQTGWPQKLENNKRAFMTDFLQRVRFTTAYPAALTPMQFVDRLFANARLDSTDPDYAASVAEFGTATDTSDASARARVLRRVAENPTLTRLQFNQAFVLMEYFGYLRRDPNSGRDADFSGYNFWLDKLREFNGNYENAEMVKAFLSSFEYRGRFPR